MTEKAPLFGMAPRKHWPVLLKTALLLINRMLPAGHPWQDQALSDLDTLADGIVSAQAVAPEDLDAVLAAFGREHPIGGSPFAAFLATRMMDVDRRLAGNALSAWILAAALRRQCKTPTQNAITQGLNKARNLKMKAPEALDELTGAFESPRSLQSALDQARERTPDKTVKGYFGSLSALMRSAIVGGEAIYRDRDVSEVSPSETLPIVETPDSSGITQISGGIALEPSDFAGPDELQRADTAAAERTLRGKDDAEDFSPARTAKTRVRQAQRATARRELSLSAEQDPLSTHEITVLLSALKDRRRDRANATLLTDLAFGTAPARAQNKWRTINDRPGLSLSVELPAFDALVETGDTFSDDQRLFLPAPEGATFSIDDEVTSADVNSFLKALRPQLARSLTRGRIGRYKADWLHRTGADAAVIGFLTGVLPANRAQMHYTCLDQETLVGWHLFYLERGLGLPISYWSVPAGYYGSRLRVPHAFLAGIFKDARKDVIAKRLPGLGSTNQMRDAHNAFALYTMMVLYLATGHRPVSHPFEFFSDFDLDAKLIWVSDKTGRGARGARMLPLTPSAVSQTNAWIVHLQRLQQRLSLTDPAQAKLVQSSLSPEDSAQGPFILIFDAAGKLVPLRPSVQTDAFATVLPTALNWTRHILRSALITTCRPAAIDAFLGHGHSGEDPFVAGSSLGLRDLWPVADAIEELFSKMSIKVVESPL